MDILADSLSLIKPSPTMAVTQRAAVLRAQGIDILSLSVGEPDFPTPLHIVEAAKSSMDKGLTGYTPAMGIDSLREAAAQQSEKVRGVSCSANNIIITVGAKHALFEFFQTVINPGDEVIIPAPYWVSYPDQVRLFGGIPVIARTSPENEFQLTEEEFHRLLTPKTKVLLINTPGNPTGTVYSKDSLIKLTDAAVSEGVLVLCDEVYRDLVYGNQNHISPLALVKSEFRDRVFVVDGVSKSHSMTGWRIGWGIGDPEIIKGMSKIQSQSVSAPSSISQYAAEAAIKGKSEYLKDWKKEYERRRNVVCSELSKIKGIECSVPAGAFYVLPCVKGVIELMGEEATDVTLATYLLDEAHVATVPGSAFGAPGHLRISYSTSIDIVEEAMKRIAEAIEKLTAG